MSTTDRGDEEFKERREKWHRRIPRALASNHGLKFAGTH